MYFVLMPDRLNGPNMVRDSVIVWLCVKTKGGRGVLCAKTGLGVGGLLSPRQVQVGS